MKDIYHFPLKIIYGGNKIEIIKFICQINSDFSTTNTLSGPKPRIGVTKKVDKFL